MIDDGKKWYKWVHNSNLMLRSRILWHTAWNLSHNLSPIENSIGDGQIWTPDLQSTSLTCYQLNCPDWIISLTYYESFSYLQRIHTIKYPVESTYNTLIVLLNLWKFLYALLWISSNVNIAQVTFLSPVFPGNLKYFFFF